MSVVLVSGANSGIGLETALAFARAGHRVAAGSRSEARAALLAEVAAEESLPLQFVSLDVTQDESVAQVVRTMKATFGPVDILANNAGMASAAPVELTPEQVVRDKFETREAAG